MPAQAPAARPELGKHGDVVALSRDPGGLRSRTVIAALPQSSEFTCRRVREYPRLIDDARRLGCGERNLNDVDAEEGGVGIVLRILAGTSGELLRRSHDACARNIHVQVVPVFGIGHQGVGVRSTARLHGGHLFRFPKIADVEDSDAAKSLGADSLLDATGSAIDAPSRLLHGHDQQVAVHRHIALATGTHHRGEQPRLRPVLDVVGIESLEVSDEQQIPAEREIRVGKDDLCVLIALARRGSRDPRAAAGSPARPAVRRRAAPGRHHLPSPQVRAVSVCPRALWDRRSLPVWAGSRRRCMLRADSPAVRKPGVSAVRGSAAVGLVPARCPGNAAHTTSPVRHDAERRKRSSFHQLPRASHVMRSISIR